MAAKKKRGKTRTNADYLRTVKRLKAFVPSLGKYRKRKSLSRWEKSAITRAQKKVNTASRGGTLVPLTKRQVQSLGKKNVIGHGIRAIRLRNFDPARDKMKIYKGEIITIRQGANRRWHYKRIKFRGEADTILSMEKFVTQKVRQNRRPVDFQVWTGAGRISIGSEGLSAIPIIAGFIMEYAGVDEDFENWWQGIAWSVEAKT